MYVLRFFTVQFLMLLSINFLSVSIGFSQEWKPVWESQAYHYQADTASRVTHQIQVDSVKSSAEASVYFLNKRFEKCDTCTVEDFSENPLPFADTVYFDIDHPQFLQGKMIDSNNGRFHFINPHHYVIDFNQPLDSSWQFALDGNITAKIDRSFTKNVFGRKDSLKRIVLSTNDTLLCAKNHGIVQFSSPFDGVEYRLAGFKDTAIHGETALGFHEIYDFDTGDVFMYEKDELTEPTSDVDLTIMQKFKIKEQVKNGADTIRYKARYWYKEIYAHPIETHYTTGSKKLTLEFVKSGGDRKRTNPYMKSRADFASFYPGQTVKAGAFENFVAVPPDIVTNARFYFDSNNRYTKFIGQARSYERRARDRCCYFTQIQGNIYQKGHAEFIYSKFFKEGLGLVYSDEFYFEYGEKKEMIGYVKNGDTTGNVWTNKELLTKTVDEPKKLERVQVFPNPVKDFLTIEQPGNNKVFEVLLVNGMGKKVLRKTRCRNEERINMSPYKPGIYLVLVKQGENVLKRKILKR